MRSLLALILALSIWPGSSGAAETFDQCLSDGPRVLFSGHNIPLDSVPDPSPMNLVPAYPNLGFQFPVYLTSASDGGNRVFVVEQGGVIRVFENDSDVAAAQVFLDIGNRVLFDGEQGLLGLAFDPDYAASGQFYVNYVAPSAACAGSEPCTKIVRYDVSANPDAADPSSDFLVLEFEQPRPNHNGGMIEFGPDGMLWIAAGDGGGANDTDGNAQNPTNLLGAILRIDPRGAAPYAIPPDNPFVGNQLGVREEIWSFGLRNPWRFSFDRVSGDLWIGDVGQDAMEEVDFIPAQLLVPGGINFGWNFCEGTLDVPPRQCGAITSVPPIIEYDHGQGSSVTGGYVYRGNALPSLFGAYVYADFGSGNVWSRASGVSTLLAVQAGISSFGEDRDGELYLVNLFDGAIYRLEESQGSGTGQFPLKLSETGLFSDTASLVPEPGLFEYGVIAPLWSDRAAKRRWIALPGSSQIDFDATGNWTFPVGTVLVKHFELPIDPVTMRRVETRVLLRQIDRWIAYTYQWDEAETDADLITAGTEVEFVVDPGGGPEIQTYYLPGPGDCMACHTSPEGRVLGVRTRQLNRDVDCAESSENQLAAWNQIGLFSIDIGPPSQHEAYADPADTNAPTEDRSRAYLATNCSICHQPLGPAPGGMDMRFDTSLADTNLVGVAVTEGSHGLANPERIKPGVKEESMVWHRVQSTDASIRMPAGTRVPDPLAVDLLDEWIDFDIALPEPFGGALTGTFTAFAACFNVTSGQFVPAAVNADNASWDCEAAGLGFIPGDTVAAIGVGGVLGGADPVGGSIAGATPQGALCDNLTTAQQVFATVPPGETSWDCEAGGLAVNPGDLVRVIGVATAD